MRYNNSSLSAVNRDCNLYLLILKNILDEELKEELDSRIELVDDKSVNVKTCFVTEYNII